MRTTYGSAIFREHVPDRSAGAVSLLEAAGHALVGKTNLHEFAYGITSENEHYGDVVNPLDPTRIPGGSSGGSAAALAAGLCEIALGTDSAGSIRIPAACCGVAGFKPTHGLVPLDGVFPLAPSYDVAGPMARSAAACRETMTSLVPNRACDDGVVLADLRVGVAWLERADPLVRARVAEAAARFGSQTPLEAPLLTGETYPVFMREVADVHRDLFRENARLYGENVRIKIERCLRVTADEYEAAREARERYSQRWAALVDDVDLVVTPTIPTVAPPVGLGDLALRDELISLTYPFSTLGWPALALPCGPAEAGLPASLQLAAPSGHDALVLAAGVVLEAALASTI